MEFTQAEITALFEGLMLAEQRKLKPLFPRCRFKTEVYDDAVILHASNGRRKCKVTITKTILMECWRNERYGLDDSLCDGTYTVMTDEDVIQLARYLQKVYFPLLEQPDKCSDELFPEIWE
ncbi:hypothetical protein QMP26_05860 [Enterocloster clostridioformis]|uniref:hypothetical protein n=1 Tax=Enterocloster clostridioformis TaxID=1531 RepID=UPI002674516F|nr:hypothetical protein [Enterocloster clostridioformis]